jgi:peptide/nickel transport system permease protein
MAALALLFRLPPEMVVAAVVFPRVSATAQELLETNRNLPHVVCARARGLGRFRLFFLHVLPPAFLPIVALIAVSVTLGFSASIPIEVYMDVPGLGQLAWRAALGRDMPVLIAVTLLLATVTVGCNLISELVSEGIKARSTRT